MLAFMPRSPLPPLDSHMSSHHHQIVENRRPLALLPSSSTPMTFNQQGFQATFPPSPAKKPKLSLNTSSISPIFGKGATSLRLETLSATSPTARNTFANRYDGVSPETPSQRPVLTPIATNIEDASTDPTSPSQISIPDSEDDTTNSSRSRTASVTSITSVSTVDSLPSEPPYKLPFNANSILSNGPIPRIPNRKFSFSQSRPMFPAAKKVGFRAPLTEEVRNTKYTMKHSDIETLLPSISTVSENDTVEPLKTVEDDSALSSPTGVKRESAEVEEDSGSNAATPVSGRAKRHRWVWTLGPIQSAPVEGATSAGSLVEGVSPAS